MDTKKIQMELNGQRNKLSQLLMRKLNLEEQLKQAQKLEEQKKDLEDEIRQNQVVIVTLETVLEKLIDKEPKPSKE